LITLHDLPGFGTIEFPTNEYEKTMKLYEYDYILIFVGNIEENDLEIAKKLREIVLIKEDFPTPDLPVTANFTGSLLQLFRSSFKSFDNASLSRLS
jgi:beta-galactosidase GanA